MGFNQHATRTKPSEKKGAVVLYLLALRVFRYETIIPFACEAHIALPFSRQANKSEPRVDFIADVPSYHPMLACLLYFLHQILENCSIRMWSIHTYTRTHKIQQQYTIDYYYYRIL